MRRCGWFWFGDMTRCWMRGGLLLWLVLVVPVCAPRWAVRKRV